MKGSVFDLLIIIIMVFVFAIIAILSLTVINSAETALEPILDTEAQYQITRGVTFLQNLDYAIVFLLFGSFVAVVIGSYIIDSHPIFLVISFLFLVFIILIGAQVTNIYVEFTQATPLVEAAAEFPLTLYTFQNLPLIAGVFGFIILIVLYAKDRGVGSGVQF